MDSVIGFMGVKDKERLQFMKTFLCEYIHPKARHALEEFSEIISDWNHLKECDAVISRNLKLTGEILAGATKLKVIAVHGTGMDGVDMEAAKMRNIIVFNTPYRNAASVAELNIALMLMTARKITQIQRNMAEGASFADPGVMSGLKGSELGGKTVAFLGVGEIAKRTIAICKNGFAMDCTGWSKSLTKEKAERLGIKYADSIEAAVKHADFVVLGMALTEETKGIIGKKQFDAMKPGTIFINTARGALVDEDALCKALTTQNGNDTPHLLAAGIDVLAEEPFTIKHPLYQLSNVVLTPHIGANTEEALLRVGMACVDGIFENLGL